MRQLKHYFFILLILSIFAGNSEKAVAEQLPSNDSVAQPEAKTSSEQKTEAVSDTPPPSPNSTNTESSQTAAQQSPPESDKNNPKAKRIQASASLPLRITSLFAGIAIGAPIATFRRIVGEDTEAAETVTYGKKHSGLKLAARIVLLPVCIVPGAIEGISYAVENSCKHSGTAPLSKESFSLGDLGAAEK